ncbi:MAG: FAD-dependent oxidoreductase, partial [Gammaproteobacteria bacterium]
REIRLATPQRQVVFENDGSTHTVSTNQVYSTIPVTLLTRLLDTPVPPDVQAASEALRFRSMVLVYLLLAQDRFTEFDAHYFPGEEFPFTRISETKNYSDRSAPQGRTSLCAEIPCFLGDEIWSMPERELADRVGAGLARAGLPVNAELLEVHAERIPHAYPLFGIGYEQHFSRLDTWLDEREGLLSFGRQGLYVHDNTHHAIFMAQAAVRCLRADGSIDSGAWHEQRKVFEKHVVED